jgi:CheY-like chemotaxis protein
MIGLHGWELAPSRKVRFSVKKKRVLIIEDQPLNLKMMRVLLEIDGYEVLMAVDAEAGLAIVRCEQPDLILMDIQLPGIDGLTATRMIKEDPLLKHIQVIAVTSRAMSGDREKALAAGCVGYITKPIDTRTFTREISRFLQESQPEE